MLIEFLSGLLNVLTDPLQGVTCRKGQEGEQEKKPGYGPFHGFPPFGVWIYTKPLSQKEKFSTGGLFRAASPLTFEPCGIKGKA
jgi:hypothetical protein